MKIIKNLIALSAIATSATIIYKAFSLPRTQQIKKSTDSKTTTTENNKNYQENDFHESEDDFEYRTQKMMKELEMTEAQKEKYKATIKEVITNWEKKNPNRELKVKDIIKEENEYLSAALNEVQYGIYRDWVDRY